MNIIYLQVWGIKIIPINNQIIQKDRIRKLKTIKIKLKKISLMMLNSIHIFFSKKNFYDETFSSKFI
jgi:hypothetical protein